MKPSSPKVSPLRQRMSDDMRLRKLELKTRTACIRAVCKLATFLHCSPDTATEGDLRRFQLYLVDQGTSAIPINATIFGLKSAGLDRASRTAEHSRRRNHPQKETP